MNIIDIFDTKFIWYLIIFLGVFSGGSLILLHNKVFLLFNINRQRKKLEIINEKLDGISNDEENSKPVITNFINDLSDRVLIKTIISEWLNLQRSLSNFQKYDFDIHIDTFLERYKFNASIFTRNLLLIGLLFTFLYLSYSFVQLGEELGGGGNASTYINQILIPNVGMALTSTIAAIIISFIVNTFGSYLENRVNKLHKELSDFLIIHVHPTFETAAEDTYINKIKTLLESLTQNIRESNQNLDTISRQSMNTLKQLGEGISKFTVSTEEFKGLLRDFSQVQEQINDQNKEIRLAVSGLKDSVQAINTVFESESNVIKHVAESAQKQSENIESLIEATNGLNEKVSQEMADLKREFNNELIQTLENNSTKLNSSLESSVESFEHISQMLNEEFSDNKNLRADQIEKLNRALTQITEEFSNKIKELNKNTIAREKRFEEHTQIIISQQKKLLDQTSKYLKAVKKRVGLYNSIKSIFN